MKIEPNVTEIKSSHWSWNIDRDNIKNIESSNRRAFEFAFTNTYLFDQVGRHEFTHVSEAQEGDILVYFRAISSFWKCEVLDGEDRPRRHVVFLL